MSIEILEYVAVPPDMLNMSKFPKIGSLKLKLTPQINIWVDILKGKQPGAFYIHVPTTRVGDKWAACYEFSNQPQFGKYLMEQFGEIIKAKYL